MKFGGLIPFSLCEFPGCSAAVVFTQGCNFRCPFCHNPELIPSEAAPGSDLTQEHVLAFLSRRRGQLDGVAVTGGEPTLQPDLPEFLQSVQALGYRVKLDTNGSRPDMLRQVLDARLVDYIEMDLKAPPEAFPRVAGVPVPDAAIDDSIRAIVDSGIRHEFRTTVVRDLLSVDDLDAIRRAVPDGSRHRWQRFRPGAVLDPSLRA
jgi:pyruvate formate lyase activating enzyme